jgi:hypothetical protein
VISPAAPIPLSGSGRDTAGRDDRAGTHTSALERLRFSYRSPRATRTHLHYYLQTRRARHSDASVKLYAFLNDPDLCSGQFDAASWCGH